MQMIRGRLCDDTKPETFNQLWTVEEQVMHTSCLFELEDSRLLLVELAPPGSVCCCTAVPCNHEFKILTFIHLFAYFKNFGF